MVPETKIDIHLRKMKNKKNRSIRKISNHKPHQRSSFFCAYRIFKLKSKPNLTEDEKIELEELTEFIKEDNKRQTKNLNKRYGLPEDAPREISCRLLDEEILKLQKKTEEIKIETRTIMREYKEREKEFKLNIEQMKKDAWKVHELLYKDYKGKHYVENTSTFGSEEKIECSPCISSVCPPPLKNKAKKNKLLNMATG